MRPNELRIFALLASLPISGCSTPTPIDVGSNFSDGGRSDTGAPNVDPSIDYLCRSDGQLPIVGTWEGYIENFKFESGSDAIRVTIVAATAAKVCGRVTLGEGEPPAPPTNSELGYPPGYEAVPPPFLSGFLTVQRAEGAPLSFVGGKMTGERFTFGADWRELWKPWCALQPPVSLGDGLGYGCLDVIGSTMNVDGGCTYQDRSRQTFPVDCGKLELCTKRICSCTASACDLEPQAAWNFDLRITDDRATGSVKRDGLDSALHNVYLTRAK